MNNSINISSSAMLVELSIRSWTARKLDKRVSSEVDTAKGAKTRVVNANKNLLAGTGVLDTIIKYAANARAWHNAQTLPWSDNGSRLLPVSNFLNYKEQLGVLEQNYNALVAKFITAYPDLVSAAAFQLGDLFDRSEYPDASKIATKFSFNYSFFPVPTAGNFIIDTVEEAKREVQESCNRAYDERLNNAMREAWDRLHECLIRMSERLAPATPRPLKDGTFTDVPVFRDSLVENALELTNLLTHFNLTNDTNLDLAKQELYQAIKNHDADSLRKNALAREAVKSKVDAILNKFNF